MELGVLLTRALSVSPKVARDEAQLGAMLLRKVQRQSAVDELVNWIVAELAKGDEEGHEFHGNQWTGGIGGGEKPQEDKPTAASAPKGNTTEQLHQLLSSSKSFTLQELVHATGSNETRIKQLIRGLQDPKYATSKRPVLNIQKTPDGKYIVVGTKEKTAEDAKPSAPKIEAAPKPEVLGIKADHFSSDPNAAGKFAQDNRAIHELINNDEGKKSSEWKAQISKELAERLKNNPAWQKMLAQTKIGYSHQESMTNEQATSRLIGKWAGTSGDHDDTARAMQLAARDVFGLNSADTSHMGFKTREEANQIWQRAAGGIFGKYAADVTPQETQDVKSAFRAFTRAEYENTQAWFAKNGIKEVAVFRGMKGTGVNSTTPKVMMLNGQPLSSYSTAFNTASAFGNSIHMAVFPVSQIVGSCKTGRGCLSERELVVMGKPTQVVRAPRKAFQYSYGEGTSGRLFDRVGREAFSKHKGKG